jgi:uncharacterized protein YdeI (YjbR/CyaY-like superfamily)
VPLDVPAVFGRARAKVRGTVNGAPFRSTVAAYGGRYFLPVNRVLREAAGATAGETVVVELERDDAPRVVEVPDDLREALDADDAARACFDGLSYTHRREYVEWIGEAKRADTRDRRIRKALDLLREGRSQR